MVRCLRDRARRELRRFVRRGRGDVAHERFRGGDRARRGGAKLVEDRRDACVEVGGGNDVVHETDPLRVQRVEAFAGDEQRARRRRADLRQDERRDHGRNDAELDLGEAEDRIVGGDDDVGGGDQTAAAAERGAVHARDHRLRTTVDRDQHRGHRLGVADVLRFREFERRAHPRDVGAAAKGFAGAGEHDRPDARVGTQGLEGIAQRGDQLGVEGVPDVGPVHGDARARPVPLDLHERVDHRGGFHALRRTSASSRRTLAVRTPCKGTYAPGTPLRGRIPA